MPPGRENLSRATGLLYLNFNPNPGLPAMGGFPHGSPFPEPPLRRTVFPCAKLLAAGGSLRFDRQVPSNGAKPVCPPQSLLFPIHTRTY